ncbi:MFS transporter [Priestia megaterium]|uniref:MFS transporter n=1 Tax=Priestia megaterium TaxID=1404 RepID=UPI00203D2A10|nr:MFS transporter [Priestia megaterium]MCM3303745.1 MFS transporter [Priestia megaterium]
MSRQKASYKWMILFIATLSQACATFVTYGAGPLAAFWQRLYDLSQFQTGLLVSAVQIGPIFSMLLFGNWMDRYGERWLVGGGSILLGISMLFAYRADHYMYLTGVLLAAGVWYGTAQPGGSKAVVKWFPSHHRGLAMGVRQTGIPIGGAVASAALPLLFHQYGWHGAVLVQAAAAIGGGLLFFVFYREQSSSSEKKETFTLRQKIKRISQDKTLYPLFFVGVSMISLQIIIVAHFMSYLTKAIKMDFASAGILLSITLLGGMAGRIVLAWVSDYVYNGNRRTPLQATVWMTAGLTIVISYIGFTLPFWLLTAFCFSLGFFAIGWFSLFIVLIAEKADNRFIGLTVSIALTLNQFAIVLAPIWFGLLVDWLRSYALAFSTVACFIACGGIWLKKERVHSFLNKNVTK